VGALLDADDMHKGRGAKARLGALACSNGLPKRRVREALEAVGLGGAGRRRIGGFPLGMRQRLGIATALLGDPPVLISDEPVNGLDPEGIRWARELFRSLAAEGRTVFVSSHMMGEMANTAGHLIVIGGGRLIADEPAADFAARATTASVTVRAPDPTALTGVLRDAGGSVLPGGPGVLGVSGLTAARINGLAFTHHVRVHEVTAHGGTLEDAFMQLTADSVQYRAAVASSERGEGR
jgi:ABC-2 type transport system ATP-binding protein